jgi:hypothetical protein
MEIPNIFVEAVAPDFSVLGLQLWKANGARPAIRSVRKGFISGKV